MNGLFEFAAQNARREFGPKAPIDLPHRESHPCGGCGRPAAYLDRSTSGVVAFVCYACDPKGHPTLVAPVKR